MENMSVAEQPVNDGKQPAPAPAEKPAKKKKRKYKRGQIKAWMRPPLADDSEDEGNDRDEKEEQRFRKLCLCEPRPDSMAECTCGCLVEYTRTAWKKHKAKYGLDLD